MLGATLAPAAAFAAPADAISVVDGKTAPVFDYADAIRERIFIPVAGVDQDLDGVTDVTALDVIRPRESDGALKVPAIIDASPYYTTLGRGNESEHIEDVDGDGINDVWPLFLDNYFVPRGYAVLLAHMDGTAASTGCPMQGGPGDIASMKVVIDWLQGRVPGFDADGNPVTATWHNGKAGMTGKSYDGTLANGVAATGVEGLTTIVPISAITEWYRYSRTGGIRHNTDYPASLSNTVTNPDRRALCAPTRETMSAIDGDETGDINQFWADRGYLKDVGKIKASVFAVHGLNDDNVRMSQLGDYWSALSERDVPRKIWLSKLGHVDPFDYRRDEWVDTLHRWFDYWLQGVQNGIMTEPQATVETDPGEYEDYASWPVPGTEPVDVFLSGTEAGAAGALELQAGGGLDSLSFTGAANPNENTLIDDPEGSQASRLVFLSEPLESDLRISGTPTVQLSAALDQPQSNLSAILVDYGTTVRTPRSPGDGVVNTEQSSCWGEASENDDACYLEVERRSAETSFWRVTRGVLDSSNRESLIDGQATPVVPGQKYGFSWPLEPYDQVFPAGHRIGVVVATNLRGFVAGTPATTLTVDTTVSKIVLPVVGGLQAAADSAGLGVPAPVTLGFDLGGHGEAIPEQTVAYGETAVEPSAPTADELFFQGWFADAEHTVAFDFTAPLTANATAYASWATAAELAASLEIEASETSVDQGDSITVAVTAFDAAGSPLGDVTDEVTLTSSVESDVIEGDTITFVHASPHLITATLGGASETLSIWVEPAPDVEEPGSGEDPDVEEPGSGGSGGSGGSDDEPGSSVSQPSSGSQGELAQTGVTLATPLTLLAALLVAAGAVFIMVRRRRTASEDPTD
ncbi:CocE/NonD family hydrolase [Compostimonas suwonensis]|uniref:X-Pro dipeptidyl-peptidase n=1 Tax=Compostimonas suwonensis TaxID=1048394 RepID=A0A2M9C3X3_9MICO|nr:CocE/NonD family hydrolase [Compostimonas suwonensis]PJJ65189.1 X-Pro dipeptidyl-peptidase [Compostimonas suwonensis]